MLAAAVALAFDMTSVLGLMYPGRERVELTGSDGVTYVYACKPGPAGEMPLAQAAKAQAAFEENAAKFGELFAADLMQDIEAGAPTLGMALDMTRKTDGWAGAITTHLEKTYGCALLG
jgi:hypothetical protein